MKKMLAAIGLWLATTLGYADAIAQFKSFITSVNTMTADFIQTVVTSSKTEQATGKVEIWRPGKFRWTYDTPFKQIIIGRDKTLWVYDVALAQVTKKSMNTFVSPTYEMLLSGSTLLERSYKLANEPSRDGVEWMRATSKGIHNLFRSVRMGFCDNTLVAMELVDGFNQRIVLQFTHIKKNVALKAQRFEPVYPKEVNVLSD